MSNKKEVKGIRSAYIFIPTIVIIAAIYILIIISTVFIVTYMSEDTKEMTDTATVTSEISQLQGTSSKLSKTAQSFVLNPTVGNPASPIVNMGPLNAYLQDLTDETRKPADAIPILEKYNVSTNVINNVKTAVDKINYMIQYQAHALYLVKAYLDEKNVSYEPTLFDSVAKYELTDTEKALSADEKKSKAYEVLLTNREYQDAEGVVSESLRAASSEVTETSLARQKELTANIKMSRGLLWGSILLILVFNIIFFAILLRRLVFPIIRFAKRIDDNEKLDSTHSLYEANYLAYSYNALLDRHKEFENELRYVAEYDSLTGLPNRYSYNEFLKNAVEDEKSVCIFLFDLNNLKFVNDTYGHAKGDELIKNASLCIKECFLDEAGKNCYRIGGDEFVSILDNIDKEDINKYLDKFTELEKKHKVSIAVGCAYAKSIKDIGYERLIISADKNMYKNKSEMYKKQENKIDLDN